jgi:hypothetical protein
MANLQQLANEMRKKIYLYRLSNMTVAHSVTAYSVGDKVENITEDQIGKLTIIEIIGAYVPKEE